VSASLRFHNAHFLIDLMKLSRRFFFAAMGSVAYKSLAWAQRVPTDDPLFRLAGSCILAGSRAPELHPVLARLLEADALGGVLVSGENIRRRGSLRRTIESIGTHTPAGVPPCLVAADQEGGTVSHLSPLLPHMPSLHNLGLLDDPALTQRWGAAMGRSLREVGVNFDLAPVLDVRTNPENMVVHLRTFGSRPEVVARHAKPVVRGLMGAGVLACAKHFPGHGATTVDSHQGLPIVQHDIARLEAVELVPFREVIEEIPAVMLAHVVYAGVDSQRPATLSRAIAHGVLRERLHFEGVAVSDDLEMSAIRRHWGVPTGAVRSMEAGCDLLIIAHTPPVALEAIRAMARRAAEDTQFRARLEEASQRVRALKERAAAPVPPGATREDAGRVIRDILRRNAERGIVSRHHRDPTIAPQH
jgi:beta-N-acetylhexosaminidase